MTHAEKKILKTVVQQNKVTATTVLLYAGYDRRDFLKNEATTYYIDILCEFFDKQQYTDIDILRRFLRTRQQHIIFTYCMNVLTHIRTSKLYVY
jgi:hypothetical protein